MPEAGSPLPAPADVEASGSRVNEPAADKAAQALCLFAALVSAAEPLALWRILAREAARFFDVDIVRLYLADAGTGELRCVAAGGSRNGEGLTGGAWPLEAVRRALVVGRLVQGPGQTLAVPIMAAGAPAAVLEIAGRRRPFSADAHRLAALAVAAGVALETVGRSVELLTLKSYSNAIVQATSDAVIGLDAGGRLVGCNPAALRMLRRRASDVLGKPARKIFRGDSDWLVETSKRVMATGLAEGAMDARLHLGRRSLDVNATILPLANRRPGSAAALLVLDDVTGQKHASEVLSRYLDPRLAARILRGGSERAASHSVRATLLFCDLRNSTGLAESLGAYQTLALLNEHFSRMVECLRAEGGMIDKFIGDALLATFGIPCPSGDDEDRAVRAAIAMSAALARWNETRAASGLVQVDMGIGINTAVVVAGSVGSSSRREYTAVGAGVNVAARLEKACKTSGAAILATASTVRRLKGRYAIRPADALVVPGRTAPVEIYEILGHLDAGSVPNLPRLILVFRRAFALKRQGRFADAMAGFSECLSLYAADRAAARQIEICHAAMASTAG